MAIFPDVPRNRKFVDRDGNITDDWKNFIDQLILALQINFKTEGLVVPQETASNIALLTAAASIANIIYDSTNNRFQGNVNGTWKTFLS